MDGFKDDEWMGGTDEWMGGFLDDKPLKVLCWMGS